MALKPDVTDKNHDSVMKHIKKLENKGTAQAEEQLSKEFNMGENVIKMPSSVEKVALKK